MRWFLLIFLLFLGLFDLVELRIEFQKLFLGELKSLPWLKSSRGFFIAPKMELKLLIQPA